jgi:hypothetical protein
VISNRRKLSRRHHTQDRLQAPWRRNTSWGPTQAIRRAPPVTGALQRGRTSRPQSHQSKSHQLRSTGSVSVICMEGTDRLQLIAALTNHIVNEESKGGILIFLPGVQEIKQCMQAIGMVVDKQVDVLPLHANLSSDEQRRVFHTNPSKWKIVCSTNVAEVHESCFHSLVVTHPHHRHRSLLMILCISLILGG